MFPVMLMHKSVFIHAEGHVTNPRGGVASAVRGAYKGCWPRRSGSSWLRLIGGLFSVFLSRSASDVMTRMKKPCARRLPNAACARELTLSVAA